VPSGKNSSIALINIGSTPYLKAEMDELRQLHSPGTLGGYLLLKIGKRRINGAGFTSGDTHPVMIPIASPLVSTSIQEKQ